MNPPPAFEIKILSQGWLGPPANWPHDTCSGGTLRVTIGGVVVAEADDYGIVQSALALLRTLERDYSPDHPVGGVTSLLCHHCGFPYIFGCGNFGTTWSVHHDGGDVVIGDVHHDDSVRLVRHLSFPDATVRLPLAEYRRTVVGFAETAREFYLAAGEKIVEPLDREGHEAFWHEFDVLLMKHLDLVTNGE